ncbi:unnamed protein product [Scytosiphon promiscuus]
MMITTTSTGDASRVDALYYGQGLGGVIFDCLNNRDAEGNSLLAKVAGGAGPVSLVRVVLKWGADVNSANNRGETALRLAMSKRNVEVIDLLVNNPAIRLNAGEPGKSFLHEAAALGLHHLTAQLVSKGLDVNGVDPENGWTPVHYACKNGRDELARLLTSRSDTMVDLAGVGGATPLHLAASGGYAKCVTNLLENNASPVVKNNKGQVPAVVAMLHGHAPIAKNLLQAFAAAKTAPKRSHAMATIAGVALAAGVSHPSDPAPSADADGNPGRCKHKRKQTPLTFREREEANRQYQSKHVNVLARTARDHALSSSSMHKENPSSRETKQDRTYSIVPGRPTETRLHSTTQVDGSQGPGVGGGWDGSDVGDGSSAARSMSNASSRVRLSRRASEAGMAVDLDASTLEDLAPHRWDDDDVRCAVALAEKGEVWCLASLFALGLDPTCQHPDTGDTIGHAATQGGHLETLEICLETGVPFAVKNDSGRSALHVAVVRDDLEVAALLLVNPGLSGLEVEDLCDPDADGRTPLHEMAIRGQVPTVLLLATDADSEWTNTPIDDAGGGGDDGNLGASRLSAGSINPTRSNSVGAVAARMSVDHGTITADPGAAPASCTPAPSSVRHPLPLSAFAPPSLAETRELCDYHAQQRSGPGDNAGPAGAGKEGAGGEPAAIGISVNSNIRTGTGDETGSAGDIKNGGDGGQVDDDRDSLDDGNGSSSNGLSFGSGQGREGNNDGHVSGWEGLLEVNARCSGSGNCPLHEAAASGSVGAVLSLLDLGADLAITNGRGDTALHVAVGPEAPRDPEDEGRWLAVTASGSISNSNGGVGVGGAGEGGGGGGEEQDAASAHGMGPTTQARESSVVTALLRRGADPSKRDGQGQTAAMCAVLAGRAGALRELRKAARCWPSRGEAGRQRELSELSRVAISEGHVGCLRVLTDGCSEQDVLAWADEEGVPALSLAVSHGQRECIDILLRVLKRLMSSKGGGEPFDPAWLERRNDLGDTVLMAALRAERHAAALLLLQAMAVPTAAAHTFRFAWVIAAALSSAELCPCPSCVLGRSAEERARLCSKVATKPSRPWEQRQGSSAMSRAGSPGGAARRRSVAFATRGNSVASKVSTPRKDDRLSRR